MRFGEAKLNLAGVDYQPKAQPYLRGAQRMLAPGEFNLLLSHNPDVFRVAREQGWNLTLAGHTTPASAKCARLPATPATRPSRA